MKYRWKIASPDDEIVAQLAASLSLPEIFARCLANRGCASSDQASCYLEPKLARLSDPFLLPDMDRAVDRLLRAHKDQERFVIFGDYDVDGVTATALLHEFFQALGWHCLYYLPHRFEEGYGLTREAIQNCLERFKVKLVLAVDCGSTACDVIGELASGGTDVIMLDHHQVSAPAPAARALVNPQRLFAHEHLKSLCSAGLAFKLAHALLKRCRTFGWPEALNFDPKDLLDFVALGTIADLVPLHGENRIFARVGLEKLAASKRSGLAALKRVAGLNGPINSHEVAFQLAPRLNAAGRLETALDALELLLTKEVSRAEALAAALDAQNRERQSLEQKIAEEVLSTVRSHFDPAADFVIVEGQPTWHLGVVGIVASRVLREFHRPAIILGSDGSDQWRGSGRSIEGFDLAAGLRGCADLLVKHGGHAMAAGVTLAAGNLAPFRARLNEIVRKQISPDALHPCLNLDAEVSLADLTFPTLQLFQRINPIGQANPPIQLAARNLQLRGEPKLFGASQQHLRLLVSDGSSMYQAVWWNCPAEFGFPSRFDLAFAPELNEYNGTYGIQLKVLDLRSSVSSLL
ncbi:MAG TPA: single-stranded-DNA-specific exonuclease RecJ [Verrucomicrobiae bacterium]|nr:single-stranded-DNA-specific exonuclease RecJ [Verrucomicrobiae bacterium]